jgi:hypothetical protein
MSCQHMRHNLVREEDRALGNECAKTIPNSYVSTRPERIPTRNVFDWLADTAFLADTQRSR